MKYTERSLRIINNAEKVAGQTTEIVLPIHLLMGALLERTGVCAELLINFPTLYESLYNQINKKGYGVREERMNYSPFTTVISNSTKQVLMSAQKRMERFKQVYVNEGLIINALFELNDPLTTSITRGLDIKRILEIASYPRDLIVPLKDYSLPEIKNRGFIVRRAESKDFVSLKNFVYKEYGDGWIISIENGISKGKIPIYIAEKDGEILGFACFDVVRNKKGIFGPMGTSITNRIQGIGNALLHYCLKEMKEFGYEYAIIGEAGPIEFYEKTCNAVIIPKPLIVKKCT
ncbi:GNAT family N-acetyltransferase [Jeotgalibacillus sp. ET6]|uniref:GNAT family N-acetyltransferase n=1 Tax=Jeotgalibacillus sp. ET6 TaxID=3037260 RepID=UPI0024188042|nr:GNAT family N-acetyltransferase [Jeotgalibacillus sp. ET6]MDG5471273.1 GNAT family N-acetyltransferase [Jeotgalibacillus sp. ET6]